MLELGHLGQRMVSTRIFPSWVAHLVDLIAEADDPSRQTSDVDAITHRLVELGAPSEAVARELAAALVCRGLPDDTPETSDGRATADPTFEQYDEHLDLLDRSGAQSIAPSGLWAFAPV